MYVYTVQPQPPQLEWWKPLLVIGGLFALDAVLDELDSPVERTCSVCGISGHNRLTCPHDGQRVNFSRAIPRSSHCECCGQPSKTHRHHTRGRADDSDFLDVCTGCHLTCCHDGDFNTIGIKPRVCRVRNRRSSWMI